MKTLILALVLGGPQWASVEGWTMEGNPYAVPEGVAGTLQAAAAICPVTGRIEWHSVPFLCGDRLSTGCVLEYDPPRIGVTYGSDTLAHELAHIAAVACGGEVADIARRIRESDSHQASRR